MEIKEKILKNQIYLLYNAKCSVAFIKKLIFILSVICFVNCELRWNQIEELTEKITKYKSDLNEIRPIVFRLRRNLNFFQEKTKRERKAFEYFLITNKERAKIRKESLEKLEVIEDKIFYGLKKVVSYTKKIKRRIDNLCNAECKITTFHYFNEFLICRGNPVLLKFKKLNEQVFGENIENSEFNSVQFVGDFCAII